MNEHVFKHSRPIYLSNGFIIFMACLWPLIIPLVVSLMLSKAQIAYNEKQKHHHYEQVESDFKKDYEVILSQAKNNAAEMIKQAERVMIDISEVNSELVHRKYELQEECRSLEERVELLQRELREDSEYISTS